MVAPLAGLRVIELARVLAGPWIGQTLADLGAEVIKIEGPKGDETRHWGPPYIEVDGEDMSAYFASCNRGKTSLIADFSKEEDRQKVMDLIASADILIENFKVGGLQKYGLDYESLSARFPALIYASVTGFGQDGPYAHRAGYDYLIQAMSGLMDITGDPQGPPQKIGVAFTDIFTGLYGVIGIQAALRHRDLTGEGQHIDLSLLDSTIGVLANQGANYLATGHSPKRMGNAHPNICPYAAFPVADGHIIIAVGNDSQFAKLCDILGLSACQSDERFATNQARVSNRDVLTALIEAKTSLITQEALLASCEASGVPAAPINTIGQIFEDPQVKHRSMVVTTDDVTTVRTPLRFSKSTLSLTKRPPKLGEGEV